MTSAREWLMDHGYDETIVYGTESDEEYGPAFIGVTTTDGQAVYDFDKMAEWLMERDQCSYEEAVEWIEFNTIGAKIDGGPIVIYAAREDADE